jgi:hypothetical protein
MCRMLLFHKAHSTSRYTWYPAAASALNHKYFEPSVVVRKCRRKAELRLPALTRVGRDHAARPSEVRLAICARILVESYGHSSDSSIRQTANEA